MPRDYVRIPSPKLGETIGLYQVCTTANTDYVVTAPAGAVAVILWFRASASDATLVQGRIAIGSSNTAITPIAADSTTMGNHPAMPMEYGLNPSRSKSGGAYADNPVYIHVANATAGAVCVGEFLFV